VCNKTQCQCQCQAYPDSTRTLCGTFVFFSVPTIVLLFHSCKHHVRLYMVSEFTLSDRILIVVYRDVYSDFTCSCSAFDIFRGSWLKSNEKQKYIESLKPTSTTGLNLNASERECLLWFILLTSCTGSTRRLRLVP